MKRVILCLDGTWNDNRPGSILTNVAKLHQVIASHGDNGAQQVSHYIEGIASTADEMAQFLKGSLGFGVGDRIRKAYELLAKDYEPGDEIYLFGFSRGAFAARSLGGLITLLGVPKRGSAFSLDKAWALYRTREKERDPSELAELRASAYYPVRIKCVGVWDTIGNIGNPFFSGGPIGRLFKFHDTRLSEIIDVGLHALSIDEVRGPFRPTLWTLPKSGSLPPYQLVEQVWFAGTHADVGGGHRETGLSDIALLWMAERAHATTGLAFDTEQLARITRPDPLGPQHSVTTGWIFSWSGLVPFIRLVKQAVAAIPPLRRMLIGIWRTGKVRRSQVPVNETLHDSVVERFGKRVIELRSERPRTMTYRPRNLVSVMPEPRIPAAQPDTAKPRRVKVFTIHGTFAYETDWDNWDRNDGGSQKKEARNFINRLSEHLKQRGVAVDELDHTQYNWSGGNSHGERRVAAIGLKKLIEEELSAQYARHGKDYYDKVFIIAHSHGGTISRLAMNLWDKDPDYYAPVKSERFDELKHDDQCPTCMRTRNGAVGRNTVRRPDGVITFGSPFVTFEQRGGGLLTARLSAWVFRILAAVPLAVVLYLAYAYFGAYAVVSWLWNNTPALVKTVLLLTWPLALYWLAASYMPRLLNPIERWFGKGNVLFALGAVIQGVKYLVLAGVAVYYLAYVTGEQDRILQWLPLDNPSFQSWLGWLHLLTVVLLLIVALPGSFLSWLKREVVGLRKKLPKKYDPAEDRAVAYVSYHTPGDEAGLHLRVFGILTWAVQTLALSAASVLTFGIALMVVIGIESALGLSQAGGLLTRLEISPVSDFPEVRDRFIALMDGLTYLPKIVWSDLVGSSWLPSLGDLEEKRAAAWYIPIALVAAILPIFLLLMPFVVLAIAVTYLASMWLRASGVVFGSEKLAWNMANKITVARHANENTALRLLFISPEAWWRRELAHCYYYKSGRVIEDVAIQIAHWSSHKPTAAWPVGAWFGSAARLLVVLLFVLSIFAVSVPIASGFASIVKSVGTLFDVNFDSGPGSQPDPKNAEAYTIRGNAYRRSGYFDRAIADYNKAIELDPNYAIGYNDRGNAYRTKGDFERAIADYNKAIELDPNLALAYTNRGSAYRARGDLDRAFVDYTKVIELYPDNAAAYIRRGGVYEAKGDADLAFADFTKAIELDPKNATYTRRLGFAKYVKGDFKGAAADLLRAIELQDDIYAMLFRFLAGTRAGETAAAELEANAARLKTKEWPYAVVELYLGKRSPAGTLEAAIKPDDRCEAQFYIGQWHIQKGNAAEAANALKVAVDTCPKDFIEYGAAIEELKRLKR